MLRHRCVFPHPGAAANGMVRARMLFGPPSLPPDPPRAIVEEHARDQPEEERVRGTIVRDTLTLEWDAPKACPDVDEFDAQLLEYLTRHKAPTEPLEIVGAVHKVEGAWELKLSLERPTKTTTRELNAEDCKLLMRGAALLVAVHVDAVSATQRVATIKQARDVTLELASKPNPSSTAAPPTEGQDTAPPGTGVVNVVTPPPVPQRRLPRLKRAQRFGILRLTGSGGLAALPGFLQELGLAGGAQLGAWRVEGELDYAPPRTTRHPSDAEISGTFQALESTIRGCWTPYVRRVDIPVCGGARFGGIRGEGADGVERPAPKWASWGALALEPAVTWSATPNVALFGSISLLVALRRPSFGIGLNPTAVYGRPAVSALVSFGIELRIFSRKNPPN